jgi:hypothetical protein
VLSKTKELESLDVARLSRQELIAGLLQCAEISFQFSAAWLNKQWTWRLRSLLAAKQRQRLELLLGLDQEGLDRP